MTRSGIKNHGFFEIWRSLLPVISVFHFFDFINFPIPRLRAAGHTNGPEITILYVSSGLQRRLSAADCPYFKFPIISLIPFFIISPFPWFLRLRAAGRRAAEWTPREGLYF